MEFFFFYHYNLRGFQFRSDGIENILKAKGDLPKPCTSMALSHVDIIKMLQPEAF